MLISFLAAFDWIMATFHVIAFIFILGLAVALFGMFSIADLLDLKNKTKFYAYCTYHPTCMSTATPPTELTLHCNIL